MMIDTLGGGVLLACALAFGWLTLLRPDHPGTEIAALTQTITASTSDLASLRAAQDRLSNLVVARKEELASRGQLPDETPVEHDLQMLSALAVANDIEVLRIAPITPRHYPGLLELRYTFETTGRFPDVVAFFESIENADSWADVGFFKIERSRGGGHAGNDMCSVAMSLSLFSSEPTTEP